MARPLSPFLFLSLSLSLALSLSLCLSLSLYVSQLCDIASITTFVLPRVHDVAPLDLHRDLGLFGRTGTWTPPHDVTDAGLHPMTGHDAWASESQIASAVTLKPLLAEET